MSADTRLFRRRLAPPLKSGLPGAHVLRSVARDPVGAAGLLIVTLIVVAAAFAPLLAPYDPLAMSNQRLAAPGPIFLLGSDEAGRDLLSRALFGARTSLSVALVVVICSAVIGVALGLVAGFFRSWVDGIVTPTMDVLFAFPTLLLALAIVSARGPGVENVVIALVVVFVPSFARITRGATLAVRREAYVESGRAVGLGNARLIMTYILPNAIAPIMVQFTTSIAVAILVEASLGYLGLGVPPPAPSWGAMLASGKALIELSIWPSVIPGLCIMVAVLGFNLLGDTLRDVLDPRMRAGR